MTAPVACCPVCEDSPLVLTLERPKKEFHCLECGGWFEYLAPRGRDATPERQQRARDASDRFAAGERGGS